MEYIYVASRQSAAGKWIWMIRWQYGGVYGCGRLSTWTSSPQARMRMAKLIGGGRVRPVVMPVARSQRKARRPADFGRTRSAGLFRAVGALSCDHLERLGLADVARLDSKQYAAAGGLGLATGCPKTSKTVREAGGLQRFRHSGLRRRCDPKIVIELRRNMTWKSLICGAGLV